MSWMTKKAFAAQVALTGYVTGAFDRLKSDERGQGSVEYIGIIIVVVVIIGAVITAVTTTSLGDTIAGLIGDAVESIGDEIN